MPIIRKTWRGNCVWVVLLPGNIVALWDGCLNLWDIAVCSTFDKANAEFDKRLA
jgi:hypothetical protein